MRRALLVSALGLVAACSSPNEEPPDVQSSRDAATDIGDGTTLADARPRDAAVDVQGFDSGPAPACTTTAAARHIVDRPGGEAADDPASMLALAGGYLVGLRHTEFLRADAGITDGSLAAGRNSAEVLALDGTGAPRGGASTVLYDGAADRITLDAPVLLPATTGAFAVYQASRGLSGETNFLLELRVNAIAADGTAGPSTVLHDRVTVPWISTRSDGSYLGVAFQYAGSGDSGIATVRPISMLLTAEAGTLRSRDGDVTRYLPSDVREAYMSGLPGTTNVLGFRSAGQLGFTRFDATALPDTRSPMLVAGAAVPPSTNTHLDGALGVDDGIVGVWTRTDSAARTEVHAIVASLRGELRLDRELESFTGEGETVASVVPGWGGAVVLWRRGTGAATRVRVAVVAPDGTIRVAATDLVAAPGANGRIVASVDGRHVAFVVRDGTAPAWGYTFGEACVPAP